MIPKKILIMRHGETDWNISKRFQGKTDVPLNKTGEHQAFLATERIQKWAPQKVFSSPLARARKTALIATGWPEERLVIAEELSELSFGLWEGKTRRELLETDPSFQKWFRAPFSFSPLQATSLEEIALNSAALWKKVLDAPEERILIVSHGGTICGLLSSALGIPIQHMWRINMGNCALSGVLWDGKRFSLAFYNDHIHSASDDNHQKFTMPIVF